MRLLILLGILIMTNVNAANFILTSHSFKNNEKIPIKYTCAGNDISPQLSWQGAPKATKSFALICADPDAVSGTFYHWVVFNMPLTLSSIKENQNLLDSVIGENSTGQQAYKGPCPPPGKIHHYIFTVYALDTQLNLPMDTNAEKLIAAMQGHILETADLIGLFSK